ncbi:MAG: hypothetical protein RIT28_301 [Pseudomonadota bacterium]|jgi:hypothetical protein
MRAPISLLLPCFLFACVDYEIKPDGDDPGEPLEETGARVSAADPRLQRH